MNGDNTTNKDAEQETKELLDKAKTNGKHGVVIIANQMGSRSYSVSEIQATVIAYDRGSVEGAEQKSSRCLTPGVAMSGEQKQIGMIVDLSFDPNRNENVERLVLEEILKVQAAMKSDFTSAVKFVLNTIDLFRVREFGQVEKVTYADMFKLLSNNDALLKVADISINHSMLVNERIIDILSMVKCQGKKIQEKAPVVGENAKKYLDGQQSMSIAEMSEKQSKDLEKLVNNAVHSLNMSATSVFDLANGGESYRECLSRVACDLSLSEEFEELFGISADGALELCECGFLNEAILDIIVQNSQEISSPF